MCNIGFTKKLVTSKTNHLFFSNNTYTNVYVKIILHMIFNKYGYKFQIEILNVYIAFFICLYLVEMFIKF